MTRGEVEVNIIQKENGSFLDWIIYEGNQGEKKEILFSGIFYWLI